jgi:hypothetical protein
MGREHLIGINLTIKAIEERLPRRSGDTSAVMPSMHGVRSDAGPQLSLFWKHVGVAPF